MSASNPERAPAVNPRNFWLWFGGIWLLVGVPFLLIGGFFAWNELTLEQRLAQAGQRADGLVLQKRWERGADGNFPAFHVRYRFATAEGKKVVSETEVSEQAWDALRERESLVVTYDADFPRLNRIDGRLAQWIMPGIFCGVGALITLLGGFVVLRALSGARFERRLREQGLTAEARIVEVAPTAYSVNRIRQWRVRYCYTDHAGVEHEGRSPPLAPEQAQRWSAGDRVRVRFDRLHPARSAWSVEP